MQTVDLEHQFYRLLQACADKIGFRMDIEDLKAYHDILSVHGFELANQAIIDIHTQLEKGESFPSVFFIRSKIEEIKRGKQQKEG